MTPLEYDRLLTPGECARKFHVDPRTVRRWANEGRITAIRTPGGTRRYREREVWALIAGSDTRQGTS